MKTKRENPCATSSSARPSSSSSAGSRGRSPGKRAAARGRKAQFIQRKVDYYSGAVAIAEGRIKRLLKAGISGPTALLPFRGQERQAKRRLAQWRSIQERFESGKPVRVRMGRAVR